MASSAMEIFNDDFLRTTIFSLSEIGVELEKSEEGRGKQLQDTVLEIIKTHNHAIKCRKTFETCISRVQRSINEQNDNEENDDANKAELYDPVAEYETATSVVAPAPASSRHFEQFEKSLWKVHHDGEVMPARNKRRRAAQHDDNNADDDDDEDAELVVGRAVEQVSVKCPLSMKIMVDPVKHVCGHTFSRSAIQEYARTARRKICPVAGCTTKLQLDKLVVDEDMKYALLQHKRTQQQQDSPANDDYEEL